MPILLAGTIEFVHIEQVSALITFRLRQVLLYTIDLPKVVPLRWDTKFHTHIKQEGTTRVDNITYLHE
jgi:hypothetical protein